MADNGNFPNLPYEEYIYVPKGRWSGRMGGGMKNAEVYGYMRVSTREQNEDRQRIALLEMGMPEKNIYIDKLSGKDFHRPQYQKLLKIKNFVEYMRKVWYSILRKGKHPLQSGCSQIG